jgi:hypothetical protein
MGLGLRKQVSYALAAAYLISMLVIGIKAGEPSEIWWWALAVLMIPCLSSAIVVGFFAAPYICRGRLWLAYIALVAIIAAYGFVRQWQVMFIGPPDPQNPIYMVFVTIGQWTAIVPLIAVVWLLGEYVFKS